MVFIFHSRLVIAKRVWDQRWVKVLLALWSVICIYDTALSQIIPESLGNRFPKVRGVIAMTSGWLPFWAWLLVSAAILVFAAFEYAFRRSTAAASSTFTPNRSTSVTSVAIPASVSEEAIVWPNHLGHTYSGPTDDLRTTAIQLAGKNASDRSIRLTDLRLTSNITGCEKAVRIATANGPKAFTEVNAIPPGGDIVLRIEFDAPTGITPTQLFESWRSMHLTVTYDGKLHTFDITEEMVKRLYSGFSPNPLGPRTTTISKNSA